MQLCYESRATKLGNFLKPQQASIYTVDSCRGKMWVCINRCTMHFLHSTAVCLVDDTGPSQDFVGKPSYCKFIISQFMEIETSFPDSVHQRAEYNEESKLMFKIVESLAWAVRLGKYRDFMFTNVYCKEMNNLLQGQLFHHELGRCLS